MRCRLEADASVPAPPSAHRTPPGYVAAASTPPSAPPPQRPAPRAAARRGARGARQARVRAKGVIGRGRRRGARMELGDGCAIGAGSRLLVRAGTVRIGARRRARRALHADRPCRHRHRRGRRAGRRGGRRRLRPPLRRPGAARPPAGDRGDARRHRRGRADRRAGGDSARRHGRRAGRGRRAVGRHARRRPGRSGRRRSGPAGVSRSAGTGTRGGSRSPRGR